MTDSEPVGANNLKVLHSGAEGRIIVSDSTSYLDDRVGPDDVIVAASFCGGVIIGGALTKGIKAIIAQDAAVGKDQAGISGLPYGDTHGVPVAAVAAGTAALSNGNSMLTGTISHANLLAQRLGVRPGQLARVASHLMLRAPAGKPIRDSVAIDSTLRAMQREANGAVYAIWTLLYLGAARYPDDVFALATHSGRVAAEHAIRWNVKGWIANDAGPGKDDSGIAGLAICGARGMPAAAVAAMSARIGDALSTYHEGKISSANEPAKDKGVTIGMQAKEALRLMLA